MSGIAEKETIQFFHVNMVHVWHISHCIVGKISMGKKRDKWRAQVEDSSVQLSRWPELCESTLYGTVNHSPTLSLDCDFSCRVSRKAFLDSPRYRWYFSPSVIIGWESLHDHIGNGLFLSLFMLPRNFLIDFWLCVVNFSRILISGFRQVTDMQIVNFLTCNGYVSGYLWFDLKTRKT